MRLAARTGRIEPPATLAMTARAQALRAAGADILNMSTGEPDFATSARICQAAAAAMARGETKYTAIAGTPALRRAVAEHMGALYGQAFKAAQVVVGTGGKQVLFNAVHCILDPGDEAVFASPYWVSYPDMVRLAGGIPVAVQAAEGGLPKAADFAPHLGGRVRLMVLNSPSNPTGAAYSRAELGALADLLRAHPQVWAVSDDIYSGLVYDGDFVGLLHVAPDLAARILTVGGVSKTHAMTGWRIGYGVGPEALVAAMADLQGACTSSPCSIAQAAALEALVGPQEEAAQMRTTFRARRDRIVAGLRGIAGVGVDRPAGAFYIFADVSAHLGGRLTTPEALCEHLLEAVGLALVPGGAFGSRRHVRLSFACSEAEIDDGVDRLRRGLALINS